MIRNMFKSLRNLRRFARREDGVASVEILFMLPTFFMLFMSAFEGGMVSTRHVMLERGVDLAVRDVRIGRMKDPEHNDLKVAICGYATIIKDCMANLQLEMVVMDLRNWDDNVLGDQVACIDKGEDVQTPVRFTNGENNELMVLIVCSLFDPVSPTTRWGKSPLASGDRPESATAEGGLATNRDYKHDSNTLSEGLQTQNGGMYALVATSAFVMEPFK